MGEVKRQRNSRIAPLAVLVVASTYHTFSQTAVNYSLVTSLFGFTFGGSTGYTTTDVIGYTNHSSTTTCACGSAAPDASPVLHNDGY
jgi:hypothetical protein